MNASIIGHPFIKLVFGRSGCYLENLELDKSFIEAKHEIVRLVKAGVQMFDPELITCLSTDFRK